MSDQPLTLVSADDQTLIITPDPDRPHWGLLGGVAIWVLSIAIPNVIGLPFLFGEREQIAAGVVSPKVVLVSVLATGAGHLLIILVCWAIVTQFGKLPFFTTLGWHWGQLSVLMRFVLVGGAILSVYVISQVLRFVLPETENTSFLEMLKSSNAARYIIAALAVVSAPFVEEVVYRGLLYSGLREHLPPMPAVILVASMFTIVHIPQYSGAWASIAGLFLLSFVLTYIRARTKSILPSFVIHLLFNVVGVYGILLGEF
jgi:membrane protease YdiL (CAAX protease family)